MKAVVQNFSRSYTDYKQLFAEVPKPLAFVDLDLFDENSRQIRQRADGKQIRIASKSLRCRSLLARILEQDSQFCGVMCYSAREAAFLSQNGFDHLLVAYPAWQPDDLAAIAGELRKRKTIILMVDCEAHVRQICEQAQKQHVEVPLCIDIDMASDLPGLHFGAWRSGIRSVESALQLAERIRSLDGVRLHGVMGYEGQIAGVGDAAPRQALQNMAVRCLKKWSMRELRQRRQAIVQALEHTGHHLELVNAGGTGSLEISAREDWVTELTAGSGFYAPVLFDHFRQFKHLPAAAFALEITRQPQKHIFTCLGGGYIASGAAGRDRLPQPYLPAGAKLIGTEGAGEVQTPISYRGPEKLSLGDPIFMRHSKAGELCERFKTLYLVSDGKIVDEVPTYRGEGLCFF